jgi:hypothetical protein
MQTKLTGIAGAVCLACAAALPAFAEQDPNLNPASAPAAANSPAGTPASGPISIERGSGATRGGTWFSAAKFTVPLVSGTPPLTYGSYHYYKSPGATSPAAYFAQVDLEPGALIDLLTCVVDDSSTTNDFFAQLQHYVTDFTAVTRSSAAVGGGSVSTTGSGGVQYVMSAVSPAETFKSYNPGPPEMLHEYFIRADVAQDTQFAGCWLWWRRQVSPAPASSSFSDVLTTDTFFQNIQAIYAAGVTTGCGGGKFCPNDYVTRGQMAAFLTRALGLSYLY